MHLAVIEQTMNSSEYQSILNSNVRPFVLIAKDELKLLDNDPAANQVLKRAVHK